MFAVRAYKHRRWPRWHANEADLLFLAAVLPREFIEVVVDFSTDNFVEEAPEFGLAGIGANFGTGQGV